MEKDPKQPAMMSSDLNLSQKIKEAGSLTELAVLLIFSSPKYRSMLESGELATKIELSKSKFSKTTNLLSSAFKTVQAKEKLDPKSLSEIAASLNQPAPTLPSCLKGLITAIHNTLTGPTQEERLVYKPAIDKAKTDVKNTRKSITRAQLSEIKMFNAPPKPVHFVSYLCRILVAGPTQKQEDWKSLREYIEKAVNLKFMSISPENVQAMKKEMESRPEITSDSLKMTSMAASNLLKMLEQIVVFSKTVEFTKKNPFYQDSTGLLLDSENEFGFLKNKKASKSGEEFDIKGSLSKAKGGNERAVPRFLIFDNSTQNTCQLSKEALTVEGLGKLVYIATSNKGQIKYDPLPVSEDTEWVLFCLE